MNGSYIHSTASGFVDKCINNNCFNKKYSDNEGNSQFCSIDCMKLYENRKY